jgi:hypothetical protein
MDETMERTPHPEDPAEGAPDVVGADRASHDGDPDRIPEHNTAPDGYAGDDGAHGGALQGDSWPEDATGGAIQGDSGAGGTGGAIQGDSSEGGTGGAIQGDADPERRTSLGGDESTEEQLSADNEVEEDSLKTLDPEDPPA